MEILGLDAYNLVGWGSLSGFSLFLALVFFYFYSEDKDKRKLMFGLALTLVSLAYATMIIGKGPTHPLTGGLFHWGAVPYVWAMVILLISSVIHVKDFAKPFIAFMIMFVTIILLIVSFPFLSFIHQFTSIAIAITMGTMSAIIFPVSLYLLIRHLKISYLFFTLSIICHAVAGLTMGQVIAVDLTIPMFAFGALFIALVFPISRLEKDEEGIGSFFTVKKQLEQTRTRYEQMISRMPSGVLSFQYNKEHDTMVLNDMNILAEEMLGFKRSTSRGAWLKILFPSETKDPIYGAVMKVAHTKKSILKYVKTRGKWYHIIVYPLEGDELVLILDDVTMEKSASEKEKKLLTELADKNKELEDFAYVVSHDLKAPLRGINSLAQWLREDYDDKLDDKGKKELQMMSEKVLKMGDLIDGVLEYSRAGRRMDSPEEIDLNELVLEVVDSLSPPPGIKVKVGNKLPTIKGERLKVQQIFANLISNAIKYMDDDKGTIIIGNTNNERRWKFYIKDDGPGIDTKFQEQIFQIFQTANLKERPDSTGVGLTIVKKIVESERGKIWVRSKPGKGSTFYFTIPKQGHGGEA